MENEDELDPSAPVQASGQSGVISAGSGAPGAQQQAPQQKAPDRGSNFVGIKNYLDANKSQAGKMGDQAAGVINTSANEARSSVGDLNNTFNQQAGTGVALDQNAVNKVGQAETLNDQEKQTLKNQYNAQYGGPSSLTDLNDQYTKASQNLSKAKQNVDAAGTEEGRKNLITQINTKPRTQGITNFDNMLLQAGGGREKVEQAAQANKDVTGDVLGEANKTAQQKAADIKAQTDATRAATQAAVQGAQQNFNTDINKRLQDFQNQVIQRNNQYAQDLGDQSGLDQATMEALGLNEGQRLYDLDLNKYFSQLDPNAATKESIATQEDLLRSQALAELAGGESFLGSEGIGSASQLNPINAQAFRDDLTKKEAQLLPQRDQMMADIAAAEAAEKQFINDPTNKMQGGWVDQYNKFSNYGVQKQWENLLANLANKKGALSQFESNAGFNRTAKKG